MDACSKLNDLHEIIKMSGLQGSVLPVVREAQQFLVIGMISALIQLIEYRESSDGG